MLIRFLFCSLCVVFGSNYALSSSVETGKIQQILIFGGNGFIGSTTVDKILADYPDASITIVNRHNWYWDSEKRIKPRIHQLIHCDRHNDIKYCKDLIEFITTTEKIDIVIDFSAYERRAVAQSSELLKHRTGLYILISTDSVYDICEKHHDEPSKEEDCVRSIPDEDGERHKTYGDKKLEAEEAIIEQRLEDGGFNFVILRLPDVIGPRDATHRWWTYQLWVKLAEELPEQPIKIPIFQKEFPMSLVYVDDIADVIVRLFFAPPQVWDQVINLAWPETFNMMEVMETIEEALEVDREPVYDEITNFHMYPSVRQGPVSVEKAQSLINWKPTPFKEAVKATVDFYENAMKDTNHQMQVDEIVQIVGQTFYSAILPKYYKAVEKVYGISLHHFHGHDEL